MVKPAHLLALVGALALSPAAKPAPDKFDFKGLPFGSTESEIRSAFPEARCTVTERFTGCFLPKQTYAGEPTERITLELVDGTLQRVGVSFKPEHFAAILAAIVAKYGKPSTQDEETLISASGVKVQNLFVQWKFAFGEIGLARYSNSLSTGYMSMQTSRAQAASRAQQAERATKAKGDI